MRIAATTMALLLPVLAWGQDLSSVSDDQIRQILIQQSIAAYSGNCPCPYNRASNGSRCGKRSAYSRPGGAKPLCFPSDVSDAMIESYRKSNPGR